MPKRTVLKKTTSFITHPFARKNEPMLHIFEWIVILLSFFVIGVAVAYQQTFDYYLKNSYGRFSQSREALVQTAEEDKMFTGEELPEIIDNTAWDIYQNKWYGFEVGHPDSWTNNTQYKTATEKSAVYETIYKFRKDAEDGESGFDGYDVKVYPSSRVPKIENTNDIQKKDDVVESESECSLSAEETEIEMENDKYTLKKISIDESHPCYEPAYFYSIEKGNYIFNIVPSVGESGERFSDPEKETTKLFPEFKEAVDTLSFIPIVRPKPKPAPKADPKIGVQKPVAAKIVNGKLVCAKKNDKPRKSKKNKPGHLDLECCLDPDERPNPWCTY